MSISLQVIWARNNEAPHINKDLLPLSIFILYFTSVIDPLVTEANRHYQQYLDRCDESPTHFQTKNSEMFLFLAIILHMGHNIHNRLRDCWTRAKQFFTPFLPHYHDTRPFLVHLTLLAFYVQ
jgi:hypothetical protein